MRFLLGVIFGVLLLVVVVFIADSLTTAEGAMSPYAPGGTN